MKRNRDEATLVRIFLGEADRFEGRPLFETLVQLARETGVAGATVLRGVEGYGKSAVVHSARLLRLSEDLPLVVEIVDSEERLAPFLERAEAILEAAGCGGLVTFEKVRMIVFAPKRQPRSGKISPGL